MVPRNSWFVSYSKREESRGRKREDVNRDPQNGRHSPSWMAGRKE